MKRNDVLDNAKKIINGERQGTYGNAEDSFSIIAQMWSAYLNTEILSVDVANMMILMKVARNSSGVYKDDNWIDICGYAAQSKFAITNRCAAVEAEPTIGYLAHEKGACNDERR